MTPAEAVSWVRAVAQCAMWISLSVCTAFVCAIVVGQCVQVWRAPKVPSVPVRPSLSLSFADESQGVVRAAMETRAHRNHELLDS